MIIYTCCGCKNPWNENEIVIKTALSELELRRKVLLVCPKCNKTTFEVEVILDNSKVSLNN